jgi:hypothetical protein
VAAPKGEGTRIRIEVRKRNAFKKNSFTASTNSNTAFANQHLASRVLTSTVEAA